MKKYIAATVICVVFTACSDDRPTPQPPPPPPLERGGFNPSGVYPPRIESTDTAASDETIAQKLARASVLRAPLANDIRRAERALKAASTICKENEGDLLNLSLVFGQQLANMAQQDVMPVELLEAMPAIFFGTKNPRDCGQAMINYSAGRGGSQQNHSQSVAVMRQMFVAGVMVDQDLTNQSLPK